MVRHRIVLAATVLALLATCQAVQARLVLPSLLGRCLTGSAEVMFASDVTHQPSSRHAFCAICESRHGRPDRYICRRLSLVSFESCDVACDDCSLGDRTAGPCSKLPTHFRHQTTPPRPSPSAAAPASHSCASQAPPSPSERPIILVLITVPLPQTGSTRCAAQPPIMSAALHICTYASAFVPHTCIQKLATEASPSVPLHRWLGRSSIQSTDVRGHGSAVPNNRLQCRLCRVQQL